MDSGRVVLLAGPCPASNAIFHALRESFEDVEVVMEERQHRPAMLLRRARRLGIFTAAGQALFSIGVQPVLAHRARPRNADIARQHKLDLAPVGGPVNRVGSVNSDEAREVLRRLGPAVVVVSGTRIISAPTLECVDAPFVNLHAGITPRYRGVHGGYWALAEERPDLVGSTVHLLDTGIDTGPVLGQATFAVTEADNFATYPYLHLAAGLPLLLEAVRSLLGGQRPAGVAPLAGAASSQLRSHPTFWGYVRTRLTRRVA